MWEKVIGRRVVLIVLAFFLPLLYACEKEPEPQPAAAAPLAGVQAPQSQRKIAEETARAVVNAGVSGDTSAGGLARLDWLMRQHPNIIILALGANDGLRGVKPRAIRANLAAIIERAQAAGTRVLLAGMRMPSKYGSD